MFGFTLLFGVFFAAALWLNEQDYQQWCRGAAQYQQDCSKPAAKSSACQTLILQVYRYRVEGYLDPDSESHSWLYLRSKSGQQFEVDYDNRQWRRLGVQMTATVWNGEVEEINDGGTPARMGTNPTLRAEAKRRYLTALWVVFYLWLCFVPLMFLGADKLHEKQWRALTAE